MVTFHCSLKHRAGAEAAGSGFQPHTERVIWVNPNVSVGMLSKPRVAVLLADSRL